ncbi:AEC family transporter [Marinomonas epiphytica]
MYLALPAVLLSKLTTTEFSDLFDVPFLLGYLLSLSVMLIVCYFVAFKLLVTQRKQALIFGLGSVYGNIGFLAIPVLTAALGDWISVPLALILTLDLLVLLPVSAFLLQCLGQDLNTSQSAFQAFRKSILNPLVLSILIGVMVSLLKLELPAFLYQWLEHLGAFAGPGAMFLVGVALSGQSLGGRIRVPLMISTFKLLIFPCVVYGIMAAVGVTAAWQVAATLGAAMPCAAVLGVIAEEHNSLAVEASSAVLLTSCASLVLVPLAIHLTL